MLTLRYMPNTSSVLHLQPTLVPLLFVQSLYIFPLFNSILFIYLYVHVVRSSFGPSTLMGSWRSILVAVCCMLNHTVPYCVYRDCGPAL